MTVLEMLHTHNTTHHCSLSIAGLSETKRSAHPRPTRRCSNTLGLGVCKEIGPDLIWFVLVAVTLGEPAVLSHCVVSIIGM